MNHGYFLFTKRSEVQRKGAFSYRIERIQKNKSLIFRSFHRFSVQVLYMIPSIYRGISVVYSSITSNNNYYMFVALLHVASRCFRSFASIEIVSTLIKPAQLLQLLLFLPYLSCLPNSSCCLRSLVLRYVAISV